jgi:hypothetical protein
MWPGRDLLAAMAGVHDRLADRRRRTGAVVQAGGAVGNNHRNPPVRHRRLHRRAALAVSTVWWFVAGVALVLAILAIAAFVTHVRRDPWR